MPDERFEFGQTLEGLVLAADAQHNAALVGALREAGLDLSAKLKPAYPAKEAFALMAIVARHTFPGRSDDEAMRELGRLAVRRGLEATFLGRAVLQAAKLLGLRRSLKRLGAVMKNGNNYVEGAVHELSPRALEIQLGPLVGPRSYYQGILEECPVLLGGRDASVTHVRDDGEHTVWRVEWKD